jgi:DNA-binding transcriptional MerR regulator
MLIEPESLDLPELSARAGVSPRTVRYYIQQGLLPSPDARGPGAHYGSEHLTRLQLIKRLQREHLPLGEIRRRMERLAPSQVRQLLENPVPPPITSASHYVRDVLSEGAPMFGAIREQQLSLRSSTAPRILPGESRSRLSRSQWDRIALSPDVELHVRRPLAREQNRQVERLMEAARHIFEEDL